MSDADGARAVPPPTLDGMYRLRALTVGDWPLEQELSRDPDVVRWTYYPADMTTDQSRQRIATSLERAGTGAAQRYVVADHDGRSLGTCGIAKLDTDTPEVFFALLPAGRGVGAATVATQLLAEWALDHGYREVALEVVEGNDASEAVASRAGFGPVCRNEADHRGQRVTLTRWLRSRPQE